MTVKQLIRQLLDMPMDAKVLVSEQIHFDEKINEEDWCTKEADLVVDYEDGCVGIISNGNRIV